MVWYEVEDCLAGGGVVRDVVATAAWLACCLVSFELRGASTWQRQRRHCLKFDLSRAAHLNPNNQLTTSASVHLPPSAGAYDYFQTIQQPTFAPTDGCLLLCHCTRLQGAHGN